MTDASPSLVLEDDLASPSSATLPTPPLTHRAHSEPLPPTHHTHSAIPEQHDGTFPLGQPLLRIAFCTEEGEDDVPPCFYVSLASRVAFTLLCRPVGTDLRCSLI